MTPEQRQQLEAAAGIKAFQERFRAYMEQRQQEDLRRTIGRNYDLHIDETKGEPLQQSNEKTEQIDREFEDDLNTLEQKNKDERIGFDDWIREQREQMRQAEVVLRPQRAAPHLVPSYGHAPLSSPANRIIERPPNFDKLESLRNDAAEAMRNEFYSYQDQEHQKRLDTLFAHKDNNLDRLDAEYQLAEVRQRRQNDYFRPLPWETESEAEKGRHEVVEHAKKRREEQRHEDRELYGRNKNDPDRGR